MAQQNRVHRQASAVVALAALAAILGSAASGATALPTTSRANADAIAIRVLRPQADKGEVILFGLPSPLPAGSLVAPADPRKFGVEREMRCRTLPFPSIVVGSLDDPWMEARHAAEWADSWSSGFINAGALGHINAESHLGDWEYGLALLKLLASGVSLSLEM